MAITAACPAGRGVQGRRCPCRGPPGAVRDRGLPDDRSRPPRAAVDVVRSGPSWLLVTVAAQGRWARGGEGCSWSGTFGAAEGRSLPGLPRAASDRGRRGLFATGVGGATRDRGRRGVSRPGSAGVVRDRDRRGRRGVSRPGLPGVVRYPGLPGAAEGDSRAEMPRANRGQGCRDSGVGFGCGSSVGAAHRLAKVRRYSPGVVPSMRWKCSRRFAPVPSPASAAICSMLRSERSSSSRA